ncbi:DNA alkylation repair protein [Thiohalorhabdus methylotrophus]|uniref:DNA alkylation repair protein n=1 Tax=Thiohalorhabdus methylotrophus TaxID=3242694 RepID=A0ABV4TUK7_9GAMM
MDADAVMERLHALVEPGTIPSMAHLGINTEHALGVRVPRLRELARELGTDHELAVALWETGIHEARILASMVADPARVDGERMEAWAADFNSWDLVDQCCANLFWKAAPAWDKALAWSARDEDYPKRAGFVLMATLALHDDEAGDDAFEAFFPAIERDAGEHRDRVRKGVSWALRQIGKRSPGLNARALEVAQGLQDPVNQSKEAHRLGHEAEVELRSELVQGRLRGASS